jgi:type I restriction enzyme S subunit
MSEISYMEKLLDGFEVEWKPLGQVCRFINGRAYKQPELLGQGKYPVLRVGNFFTNDKWYYSNLELDEDKYCDTGDLLYFSASNFRIL